MTSPASNQQATAHFPDRFKGKTVIVTGAASGLGHATVLRLAREGANLVLVDLKQDAVDAVLEQIRAGGASGEAIAIAADVADKDAVAGYVDAAMQRFGRIDAFLNNAGVEGTQNLTEAFGADEFRRVLSVNLDGAFYGMAKVLPVMRAQGTGTVVNVASVGGIRGVGNQSGYAASKHGLVGLTRNSAVEYGQYGVSINAIAPGAIMTPMVEHSLRQMGGDDWEAAGKQFVSVNPMQRFGKVEEFAALACFLLSQEAPFINGATITLDGGQSYKY